MDYDSAQRRHIKCQRLVVLLWSNRFISIPVAFAFWHHRDFVKTYRTKNEIARILIYWTVRYGIGFSYLTFDNWYASKQNLIPNLDQPATNTKKVSTITDPRKRVSSL